jgi:hypothetical protein
MTKLQKANKATATLLAGATVAIVTNFWPEAFNADAQTGLQTLISFGLVYFIANK